jgi:hypothetical protein
MKEMLIQGTFILKKNNQTVNGVNLHITTSTDKRISWRRSELEKRKERVGQGKTNNKW